MKRFGYAIAYLFGLAYYMLCSSFKTLYSGLFGGIDPQVVEIQSSLKNPVSLQILANSITLTPGTITIGLDEASSRLKVAVLTPRPAKDIIPFEKHIKGMME